MFHKKPQSRCVMCHAATHPSRAAVVTKCRLLLCNNCYCVVLETLETLAREDLLEPADTLEQVVCEIYLASVV
jgi:hypothetical protein